MRDYVKPMLPAELTRPFDNKEWLFEHNLGGFRAISAISGTDAFLFADKNTLLNNEFPQIIKDLQRIHHDVVFDGELVVFNENGRPDRRKTSNLFKNTLYTVRYIISDILSVDNMSLLKTPLIERKKILENLISIDSEYLRPSKYVLEYGCDLFNKAIKTKLEGIYAKKLDSCYHPGKRTSDWIKIKNINLQEVYICGFTRSPQRKGLGSIIAGIKKDNGVLTYAGIVNVGLDNEYFQEIYKELISLVTQDPPFADEFKANRDIIWVHPVVKCEVEYLDLTKEFMPQPELSLVE
jgi:bifunctional non-homologous end joining protein LigD